MRYLHYIHDVYAFCATIAAECNPLCLFTCASIDFSAAFGPWCVRTDVYFRFCVSQKVHCSGTVGGRRAPPRSPDDRVKREFRLKMVLRDVPPKCSTRPAANATNEFMAGGDGCVAASSLFVQLLFGSPACWIYCFWVEKEPCMINGRPMATEPNSSKVGPNRKFADNDSLAAASVSIHFAQPENLNYCTEKSHKIFYWSKICRQQKESEFDSVQNSNESINKVFAQREYRSRFILLCSQQSTSVSIGIFRLYWRKNKKILFIWCVCTAWPPPNHQHSIRLNRVERKRNYVNDRNYALRTKRRHRIEISRREKVRKKQNEINR